MAVGALGTWIGCNAIAGIEEGTLAAGDGTVKPGSTMNGPSGEQSASSASSSSSSSSSSGGVPSVSCVAFDGGASGTTGSPGPIQVLASGLAGPVGVGVNATNVVWATSGQTQQQLCGNVKLRDSDGGVRAVSGFEVNPTAITISGTFAYYVNYTSYDPATSNVKRALLSGTSSATVSSGEKPTSLAIASNTVYWTELGGIYGCPIGDYCGQPTTPIVARTKPSRGLVATATKFAWMEDGSIYACSKSSCASTIVTLASGQASPRQMTIDGDTLYWTNDGDADGAGSLMTVSINGGVAASPFLCGLNHPNGIVTDASNVYFTNRGTAPDFNDGTVVKCAKTGCSNTPTLLAQSQKQPLGITLDSARVYWTTWGIDVGAGAGCNATAATGTVSSAVK